MVFDVISVLHSQQYLTDNLEQNFRIKIICSKFWYFGFIGHDKLSPNQVSPHYRFYDKSSDLSPDFSKVNHKKNFTPKISPYQTVDATSLKLFKSCSTWRVFCSTKKWIEFLNNRLLDILVI